MPSEVLLISAQALLLSMQLGAFHGVGQITSEWHNQHACADQAILMCNMNTCVYALCSARVCILNYLCVQHVHVFVHLCALLSLYVLIKPYTCAACVSVCFRAL